MRAEFPASLPPLIGLPIDRACKLLGHFGKKIHIYSAQRPHNFELRPLVAQNRAVITIDRGYVVEAGFY